MGLLDLPAPLLSWVDQSLLSALPPALRLVVWALIGSAVSMGLYRLISPQARIARLRDAAVAARRRMAAYDGEFSGLGEMALSSLGLSLRHVGVVLLPAVIASLPVVCLLAWLSNGYGYHQPEPGQIVSVQVQPPTVEAAWQGVTPQSPGSSGVVWPANGEAVRLIDAQNRVLIELPLPSAVPIVHKRQWWNRLLGNPIGYLPADGPVDQVTIDLPPRTYLDVKPDWLGSWEMIFLTVLLIASIAIKLVFRIQ